MKFTFYTFEERALQQKQMLSLLSFTFLIFAHFVSFGVPFWVPFGGLFGDQKVDRKIDPFFDPFFFVAKVCSNTSNSDYL